MHHSARPGDRAQDPVLAIHFEKQEAGEEETGTFKQTNSAALKHITELEQNFRVRRGQRSAYLAKIYLNAVLLIYLHRHKEF